MMRRGVVASIDIPAGTIITIDHIAYKRPETELKPTEINIIIGKSINCDLYKDEEMRLEYFQ